MKNEIVNLFLVFCRIGGFTFGGGYAMLPIMQKEICGHRKWATEKEVLDFYAIGQCTPGIIAINTATMVGYRRQGLPGALAATLGLVFPSLVVITVIAAFFQQFQEYQVVRQAFAGIQIAVVALLLDAVIKTWQKNIKDYFAGAVFALAFLSLAFFRVYPALVIVAAALAGILAHQTRGRKQE